MTKAVTILTGNPTVIPLAQMELIPSGLDALAAWMRDNAPETEVSDASDLLPRHGVTEARPATDNELLAELGGRTCYRSFGAKGMPRTNEAYLRSMWEGRIPHRSTGYHPHMTFFIAGVSRRVSHELIRNYVGHAKDEEGAPSQESTRYTDHPGIYIAHPRMPEVRDVVGINGMSWQAELGQYAAAMQCGYDEYLAYQQREIEAFKARHDGAMPKGMDRKRIYEAASSYLHHSCATSFVWTSNPMALCKFFEERVDAAADLEMQRFARVWRDVCLAWWPNLFVTLSPSARES